MFCYFNGLLIEFLYSLKLKSNNAKDWYGEILMSKKIYCILTLLFLPSLMLSATLSAESPSEQTEIYPTVYIIPDSAFGRKLGDVFTVTVGITGLVDKNLYGFDVMLKWDSSSLEYLSHEVRVPVQTYVDGILNEPILEVKNEVDEMEGTCWIAYASLLPAEAFNGEGVFFTITFKVIKESDSEFSFEHVFLASKEGEVIPTSDQTPVSPDVPFDSSMNEHRKLKCERWLEWWITVTWQMSKRRASASGR